VTADLLFFRRRPALAENGCSTRPSSSAGGRSWRRCSPGPG